MESWRLWRVNDHGLKAEPAAWTKARIFTVLCAFEHRHGRRPTMQEWRHPRKYSIPDVSTVRRHWRTLGEAWDAAMHTQGRTPYAATETNTPSE